MLRPGEKLGYWLLQVVTDLSKFGSVMMMWVPIGRYNFINLVLIMAINISPITYSAGPYG